MRVALLADFPVHYLPGFEDRRYGHHATWLPPLARELESRLSDIDLHWITCTKAVDAPCTLQAWNQTFHLLPRWKLSLEILTAYRRERRLIAALLQSLNPDLVHGWGTEQGYGYAATDFQGPSLVSVQGILQVCCKVAAMPWLTRIQSIHEARVLRKATHLTVESPWGADQLRTLAPHATIDLLEYGANPACFETQRNIFPIFDQPMLQSPTAQCFGESASEERKNQCESNDLYAPTETPKHRNTETPSSPLPLPTSSKSQPLSISASQHLPVALYVGTIARHKGTDTLLEAFCNPRLQGIELIVLGRGDPRLVRRALTPNIRLLGHRPPAVVREWMSKAWCLVHPTRADTSPNSVKEARVIGLPVVTTPCGGQTQYVEHGKSGIIHEAGDVEGLIKGVLEVTRDWETSMRMGTHGQAECRARLHPSATASRLLEIYKTR